MIPRRRLLQLAGASLLPAGPAIHPSHPLPRGALTDLGPASVTTPLGNGEFAGSVLYAGTRGLSPNAVGAYDLVQDKVTRHYDIPTGVGIPG